MNFSAASIPQSSYRSSRNIAVEFTGVEEGNEFDFNAEKTNFTYGDRRLELYANKDEEIVKFKHFGLSTSGTYPKSGFGIFSPVLIDNLAKENVVSMRPSQIAAMMAVCFTPPCQTPFPPDFVCISSTGSGKTIAFLAPMIQKCLGRIAASPYRRKRTPLVLIFAHSNSLVNNIYQKAMKLVKGTGVRIKLIAGGENYIHNDNFDIGICTIGRFMRHFNNKNGQDFQIDISALRYVVVDEVDSMISCEEFYGIVNSLKEKVAPIILLYSATVNANIYSIIDRKNCYAFGGQNINSVVASVKQYFWQVSSKSLSRIIGGCYDNLHTEACQVKQLQHPFDVLFYFLKQRIFNVPENKKKVIVFLKRTAIADALAIRLNCYGYPAVAVHGKQSFDIRKILLQRFINGEVKVLFATNLLTRGTDVHVDYVINYDLPIDYAEYVHRCGRTGRNQRGGRAISFVDFDNNDDYDLTVLNQIILRHNNNIKLPDFMLDFAENAAKIRDAESDLINNNI